MGVTGPEQPHNPSGKTGFLESGGAESGALDARIEVEPPFDHDEAPAENTRQEGPKQRPEAGSHNEAGCPNEAEQRGDGIPPDLRALVEALAALPESMRAAFLAAMQAAATKTT